MSAVRSLVNLCIAAFADEVNGNLEGCILLSGIYGLPSELLDGVLMCLTPLALQNLQDKWPFEVSRISESGDDYHQQSRKRKRNEVFDAAWDRLYGIRWPRCYEKPADVDWQQMYWERHLHDCVEAVAETALLPSFNGSIGEIEIPDISTLSCA